MTEKAEDPKAPNKEAAAVPQDSRIVVVMDGNTPVPKFVDFTAVTPFHLLAIGEWLSLKGRQLIATAEAMAPQQDGPQILVPGIDPNTVREVLGVKTR